MTPEELLSDLFYLPRNPGGHFEPDEAIKIIKARDQEREAALVEALKFYADESNWQIKINDHFTCEIEGNKIATTTLQKLGVTV